MANNEVKTLLIDTLILGGEITITDTGLYNVVLLSKCHDDFNGGQIISQFGSSDIDGFDSNLESFGLSLGKNDVTLSIGGNFNANTGNLSGEAVDALEDRFDNYPNEYSGNWKTSYNINHVSFNDDYVSGAVQFKGSNAFLVLTAQNGCAAASSNSDANLAFRSANFGLYGNPDGSAVFYDTTTPGTKTENYNFLAQGTLTVKSDLVGSFETVTAAVHTGYKKSGSDGKVASYNDSSNNRIIGAGIKADKLVLESNFLADIKTENNKAAAQEAGSSLGGTTIRGYANPTASNNIVANYGILTNSLETADNTIWAGSITAETKNVSILGKQENVAASADGKKDGKTATVTGNEISAYGIKVDGTLDIKELGSHEVGSAVIKATASNNTLSASAASTGENPEDAVASLEGEITAAGIYAEVLKLGKVNDNVTIEAHADNNTFRSEATAGKTTTANLNGKVFAYGIYADSADFSSFAGTIKATASGNSNSVSASTVTGSFKALAAGIWVNDALNSSSTFGGKITVAGTDGNTNSLAFGIFAKSITVNGVLDTDIQVGKIGVGIYVAESLTIDAFTGKITAGSRLDGYAHGISVQGDIAGNSRDAMDIAGTITVNSSEPANLISIALMSLARMNIRISGSIVTNGYAIMAETSLQTSGTFYGNERKFNDQVEIAAGANVTGYIDLGGGINNLIISTDAAVSGVATAKYGELNFTFNLEAEGNQNAALSIYEFSEDDKSLKDTSTQTVNLNYATAGETYKLIHYGFDAKKYWKNQNIAFKYQGFSAVMVLDADCQGSVVLHDNKGQVVAEVSAGFVGNDLCVTVEELKSSLTYNIDNKVGNIKETYDAEAETLTLNWQNVFSAQEFTNFSSLAGYEIQYTLYDENGNKLGESIVAKPESGACEYTIKGVSNNTRVDWAIRVLGDGSGNAVTQWSAVQSVDGNPDADVNTFVAVASDFVEEDVTTQCMDSVWHTTEVAGAVADLSWSKMASANAVRHYVIEYCTSSEELTEEQLDAASWNDYNTATKVVTGTQVTVSDLQNKGYLYWRIKAVDVAGGESDWVVGKSIQVSTDADFAAALSGAFTEGSFSAAVKANCTTVEKNFPKYDENNQPVLDSEGKQVYDTVYERTLVDASVVIDWSDTFNNVEHYKIVISSDPDFAEGSEQYSFWTTAEEAAATKMVFNASTTGRPVGIFENMSKVYYRVYAYDAAYNKSSASSGLHSFDFYDEVYGQKITEGAAAVPQNVKVNTKDNMVNNCHTDVVGLSWTTSGSMLGVYYYEVELLNDKGKVIATASTLDTSDKLTTDTKPATDYYSVNAASGATTVTISDLKKFFGMDSLADGSYQVRVNAYSASGTKKSSAVQKFDVDTVRPATVNVTSYSMLPSGAGEDGLNVLMIEWQKASNPADIAAYEVYWRIKGSSSWECRRIEDGKATSTAALPKEQWPEVNFTPAGGTCEFYVIAIDKQGNISELPGSNYSLTMAEDKFANTRDRAQELVGGDRMEVSDTVGIGDLNDYFIMTTDNATALTLTVGSLSAAFTGANDDIKITIYEGDSTKVWKTVSAKEAGRLFTDLLLQANTSYTFCVSSAAGNKAAANYDIVLDKKELPASTNNNTADAAEFDKDADNVGWVGFGDATDYYKLELDASGKYTFTLDGMAASTKLSIYEAGSTKAIISVTGTEKNVDGVTTKELLLDKNKVYYVEVVATNNKAYGSDYNVTMNTLESYPESAAGDNDISAATPAIGVVETVTDEWVGFGDAADYRLLDVGANGGVVNFTIEHNANMNEAVKMVVYQYTGDSKTPYKAVKTVTLAKNANSASTGSLFLTGEKGGKYYVEVSAPGSAKGQNSTYTLVTDGYVITDAMAGDDANDTVADAELIKAADPAREGWVGVNDTVDNYKFEIAVDEAGAYEFQLDDVNGKEIKAALGYLDDKGNFKAIKSVNGAAGADDLILSLDITADMITKAAGTLYLQVSANGKDANSQYTLTVAKNSTLAGPDNASVSDVDPNVSGWVGLGGNKVDYIDLDITASGFYDLNITGAENPLKAQLIEIDANGKPKSVKSISLTAVNSDGVINGVFLDKDKTYQIEITATSAAQGQNSDYNVQLNSQMGVLVANRATGAVNDADAIDAYAYEVSNPGIYSFVLNNVNGSNIKMSIVDAATGKVVKTITPAAKSDSAAISLKFDAAGTYIVKLESAGKGKASDYTLEVIERPADANNDFTTTDMLSTTQAGSGWVGLGDAADYYKLDLSVTGTGVYELVLNGLDNNAKITIYEKGKNGEKDKAIKNVSGTAAKAGVLSGLLLDAAKEYYVSVQAAQTNGTQDTNYTLSMVQTSKSQLDSDSSLERSAVFGTANWVGFADTNDYYTFTAADVSNITLNLNGDEKGDVKVIITTGGIKPTTVKTLTANSKTLVVSSGDLGLIAGQAYNVEVVATNGQKGANADYTLDIHQWNFSSYAGGAIDDNIGEGFTPTEMFFDADNLVAQAATNAVWSGDTVDYFMVVVAEDGSYTLNAALPTLNGNAVKLSIGTEKSGKFTSLQSVTGKAGTDELQFSRNLTAGTYYIKVESNGKTSAAEYELELTHNNNRAGNVFSNEDDTWQKVAAKVEDNTFGVGTLSNWVGFGDAVDVFELKFDQNGVVNFDWNDSAAYGDDALFSKEITLTLVDANGKSVALTFDKVNGSYNSNTVLMADVEYYLSVKHNKPDQSNIDYKIDVTLA